MFKKIIFLSFAFFSISLMALFTVRADNGDLSRVAPNTGRSMVVLELFTSQGCSSCPPADVLLDLVQKEFPETVVAMSYHVDYWDYIGWKDPFAKSAYTKKQNQYNIKFRSPNNYTPQMVINGKEHCVGSNSKKIYGLIESHFMRDASNTLEITETKISENTINVKYAATGDISDKQLRAVLVINERITPVKRGENKNRSLRNTNIVMAERYLNLQSNTGEVSMAIPALVSTTDTLGLILLMESENLDIAAATRKSLKL